MELNHKEAYELACYKQYNSNMARSYLALRAAAEVARTALSTLIATGDRMVFEDALAALDSVLAPNASYTSKKP